MYKYWKEIRKMTLTNDIQRLYDSAQRLVTLKQSHHDMISHASKAQSTIEEYKMSLEGLKIGHSILHN